MARLGAAICVPPNDYESFKAKLEAVGRNASATATALAQLVSSKPAAAAVQQQHVIPGGNEVRRNLAALAAVVRRQGRALAGLEASVKATFAQVFRLGRTQVRRKTSPLPVGMIFISRPGLSTVCFRLDCSSEGQFLPDGVQTVYLGSGRRQPLRVRCEAGLTVIQSRRINGSRINFDRNWTDYRNGFGSPTGDETNAISLICGVMLSTQETTGWAWSRCADC